MEFGWEGRVKREKEVGREIFFSSKILNFKLVLIIKILIIF